MEDRKSSKGSEKNGYSENDLPELTIADFKLIKTIGTGTFGKVVLGIKDDDPVAIKTLKKKVVIQLKQVEHILQEKDILQEIAHPFIVDL